MVKEVSLKTTEITNSEKASAEKKLNQTLI
jgi:hypothetical protein